MNWRHGATDQGSGWRRSGDSDQGLLVSAKTGLHLQNSFSFHRKPKTERPQVIISMNTGQCLLLNAPSSCAITLASHTDLQRNARRHTDPFFSSLAKLPLP